MYVLPPEYQKIVRDIEVGRISAKPSWRAVLPREVVPLTYNVESFKTDRQVFATVSRRPDTRGGPKGTLVQDRESVSMFVVQSKMDIPWFDEMIVKARPAGAQPSPLGNLDALNPQRLFREMVDEIERKLDVMFYEGYNQDGVSFDGFLDQDASPLSNSQSIDTAAGVKEFVANVALARKEFRRKLTPGSPVLLMDAALTHYLQFPYNDAGQTGITGKDILAGTQADPSYLPIVPVESASMQGKALLHYRDPTNAVYYESTPEGAMTHVFGQEGEDKQLVMWRQLGIHYRRAAPTNPNFRVFADLE